MNIAFDPWIPVTMPDGSSTMISVHEALTQGGNYTDLAVRPHERVALMRLLLCVSHAALDGPKDFDEWEQVPERLPEAADGYLKTWKDSFELFHAEKPWLQVAGLNLLATSKTKQKNPEDEWLPLTKLSLTRASGNNSTLFDHHASASDYEVFTDPEIALNLLTFQNYFVAGGKASSRRWGDIEMANPSNPKGGPCAGKSIIYSFGRGANLLSTMHLNMNSYEEINFVYGDGASFIGKPVWELPIDSPTNRSAIDNATKTHLGRLVPQTRILRVHNDRSRVLFGAGFYYPKFQDNNAFFPDLFSTVVLDKDQKRIPLGAKKDKSLWRELHSMSVRIKSRNDGSRGPLWLQNIENTACDIIASAMITNPSQAAEIVDLIESVYILPRQLHSELGINIYESEVRAAESIASKLGGAVETYRLEIDGGWKARLEMAGQSKGQLKVRLHSIATTHYWTTAEQHLDLLMSAIASLGSDSFAGLQTEWRSMLHASAREAYALACAQDSPRQMRAFAKGWKKLTTRKDETGEVKTDKGNQEDKE